VTPYSTFNTSAGFVLLALQACRPTVITVSKTVIPAEIGNK